MATPKRDNERAARALVDAALILHAEDWPRSATGDGALDELLGGIWRQHP